MIGDFDMKKQIYQKPNTKIHVPCELLQIGVGTGGNDGPIESKGNYAFEEEENMWGKVWGRVDDE